MINVINECIYKVINDEYSIPFSNGSEGFSGKKILGLLTLLSNNVCNESNFYLEIGVYRGLTLLTAAKSIDNSKAYGIDNFSQFDPNHKNLSFVEEKLQNNNVKHKAKIINEDFEKALSNLDNYVDGKIGLYFIDGPHDYRSQMLSLLLSKKHLAPNSIIIIDDCNYAHVRQANYDFLISHDEYKLIFEAYTHAHPKNMLSHEYNTCVEGFWNGINIIIKDDNLDFVPMLPTLSDINHFPNDHIVHSSRMPFIAPLSVNTVNNMFKFRMFRTIKGIISMYKQKAQKSNLMGKFDNLNTYSENLPEYKINDKLML